MSEKTATQVHFEEHAVEYLQSVVDGRSVSHQCGSLRVERTPWRIEMSSSFAQLILAKLAEAASPASHLGF